MKRRALSFLLLLLALFATGIPAAFGQACSTPAPTYTPTPGYRATIQAASPGDLLVYFPLNETSGATAEDDSGNNADGSYSGVTLNASTFLTGDPVGAWDGVNDLVNIFTSYLSSNFNPNEGTTAIWVRVASSSDYTDGVTRGWYLLSTSNGQNRVNGEKTSANNNISSQYVAGNVMESIVVAHTDTAWNLFVLTWSKSADQVKLYRNGVQIGTTQTTLGTWSGVISSSFALIGARTTAGGSPWHGNLSNFALWDVAFNATQVAALATIDPILTLPPTATLCPTYTPTYTPTWTPTFTPTPSNTPDLNLFWTVPPPGPTGTALPGVTGTPTPAQGQWVRFEKTFTAGQAAIALELGILALLILAVLTIWLLTRRRTPR